MDQAPPPVMAHPNASARPISPAQEKAIARSLSPAVAWPTIGLAILLPSGFLTLAWLGLTGVLPAWVCTLPMAFLSYGHYTLVHEAVHGNVVTRPQSLLWINTLVGWIGSCGLGLGWPVLQRTHQMHHSHTNTEKDPDFVVRGTFGALLWKWGRGLAQALIPIAAARFISPGGYARLSGIFSRKEIYLSSLISVFTLGLLAVALATGRTLDWLLLWFLPQRLAVLILMIFFQWLPHLPFDRSDRYGNTRISLWPGGDLLTFRQNLHLMHHLWPSVPFYNYRRLFEALRPVLVFEGSRIEGFGPGSPPPR